MDETDDRLLPVIRPVTRGDCRDGIRPCPFVSCRYNLLVDVHPDGMLVLNATGDSPPILRVTTPEREADEAIERATDAWTSYEGPSCALDVIEAAGSDETMNADIARALGVSPQRIEQIVSRARARLAAHPSLRECR